MTNLAHTCRWIIIPAFMEGGPLYCDNPVSFKMVWDGGEVGSTKVREYDTLCSEHKAAQAGQSSNPMNEDGTV